MKREHGGDDDRYRSNNKRQRGDGFTEALAQGKFELRLLVTSKSAGAIIGKGGENIKRIRSQFEGHISVPDSNTPERVLTLTSSKENVVKMVNDVLPRLEAGSNDRDKSEVRLLVHQSHAGALIGRAGSKIKELREKTNTRVKVFQATAPQSTDRVVVVGGDERCVTDAVQFIVEELKDIPIKGPVNQYSSFNYEPAAAADYGGYSPEGFTPNPNGGGRSNGPNGPGGRDMGGSMNRSMGGGGGGRDGPPSGGRFMSGGYGQSNIGRDGHSGSMPQRSGGNRGGNMGGFGGPGGPGGPSMMGPPSMMSGGMGMLGGGSMSGPPPMSNMGGMSMGGLSGMNMGMSQGGIGNMSGPPPMPVPPPQQQHQQGFMQQQQQQQMQQQMRGGGGMSGMMPQQDIFGGSSGFSTYGGQQQPPQHHQQNNSLGGGGMSQHSQQGLGGMDIQTNQVTIPSDLAGTIIGRNGERINRIREESGANIVLEQSKGQDERIITISGHQTQIHAAQYLLQQCVRSSDKGRRYYEQS